MGLTSLNVVTAFAAAAIAYRAWRTTARTYLAQVDAVRRNRESGYYRALVVDTALAVLPVFEREAIKLLLVQEQAIRAAREEAEARELTMELVSSYAALVHRVRYRLLTVVRAWDDEALVGIVGHLLLESLDDHVTRDIPRIMRGDAIVPPLDERVQGAAAEILGALVYYDLHAEPVGREAGSDGMMERVLARGGF
jgi:hypothetical protein